LYPYVGTLPLIPRHRDFDSIAFGIGLAFHRQIEIDRGHDAVAELLLDQNFQSRPVDHQRQEALQRLANGETLVAVARTYGVDATTIGRLQ
jgi:hypothetical protein